MEFEYSLVKTTGVICSGPLLGLDKFIACAAHQDVIIWDPKTHEEKERFSPLQTETEKDLQLEVPKVQSLCRAKDFAVGYSDGTIRLFPKNVVLRGHKKAVNCLCALEFELASADTEIVVWDLVSDTIKLRLVGHQGLVTGLCFLDQKLASVGVDASLRIWDLGMGSCVCTILVHRMPISCLAGMDNLLFTGSEHGFFMHKIEMKEFPESENIEMDLKSAIEIKVYKKQLLVATRDKKVVLLKLKKTLKIARNLTLNAKIQGLTLFKKGFAVSMDNKVTTYNDFEQKYSLDQGHCSPIRCLDLKDDVIATSDSKTIKIWTKNMVHTIEKKVLCLCFVGSVLVAGLKNGEINAFSLQTMDLIYSEQHHMDAVCTMQATDLLVTGSSDKQVLFFEYGFLQQKFTLNLTKTLKVSEEVIFVALGLRYVAVSLLDSSILVFNRDLKFAFSLYGHSLPVLSMDFNQDETMLLSGSADKSIRVWGLSFGDCIKTIKHHFEAVTCVKFKDYIYSSSKDKTIKIFDLKYHLVQTLKRNLDSVNQIFVNDKIWSCSSDKSIRMFEKTEELLFDVEQNVDDLLLNKEDKLVIPTNVGLTNLERIQASLSNPKEFEQCMLRIPYNDVYSTLIMVSVTMFRQMLPLFTKEMHRSLFFLVKLHFKSLQKQDIQHLKNLNPRQMLDQRRKRYGRNLSALKL